MSQHQRKDIDRYIEKALDHYFGDDELLLKYVPGICFALERHLEQVRNEFLAGHRPRLHECLHVKMSEYSGPNGEKRDAYLQEQLKQYKPE